MFDFLGLQRTLHYLFLRAREQKKKKVKCVSVPGGVSQTVHGKVRAQCQRSGEKS